jgi:hypothetical protein
MGAADQQGTILGDVETLIAKDMPSWFTDAVALALSTGPALFVLLDSVTTDPAIAAPYVETLLGLVVALVKDLANHVPEAQARAQFDSAVADMLSELKFGKK